jgi:hypothetical protein
MPIRCTISHSTQLVVAEAKGTVVLGDIEAYLDEVVVSEAMPYRKLFGALEAVPCLSDTDIMMAGARISASRSVGRCRRSQVSLASPQVPEPGRSQAARTDFRNNCQRPRMARCPAIDLPR